MESITAARASRMDASGSILTLETVGEFGYCTGARGVPAATLSRCRLIWLRDSAGDVRASLRAALGHSDCIYEDFDMTAGFVLVPAWPIRHAVSCLTAVAALALGTSLALAQAQAPAPAP